MKKIFIAIAILGLAFSCCAPDSSNGYGYSNTQKKTKNEQLSRWEVPHAKRIGYDDDYGCFIYLLEAEGHKFVLYREDIEILE